MSKKASLRKHCTVKVDSKLAGKFQTLATLKGQSLSKTVNLALADWFEVSGETQIETITGITNPLLPQLHKLPHIKQASATNIFMLMPRRHDVVN